MHQASVGFCFLLKKTVNRNEMGKLIQNFWYEVNDCIGLIRDFNMTVILDICPTPSDTERN